MKRTLLSVLGVTCTLAAVAQVRVQGQPYDFSRAKNPIAPRTTVAKATNEATFTFADVVNWSGTGENTAAVAIQWNNGAETNALVWGYNWEGTATGEMMLRAIAKQDPRFFVMAEEGTGYGSTIAGIGYDADGDGVFSIVRNGEEFFPNADGVILVSGYDYDGYSPKSSGDYWSSGWYNSYWSYWVKESATDNWGYSGLGATMRTLSNGSWDGWNFAANMMASDWLPLAAADATGPSAPSFSRQPESFTADPGMTLSLKVNVKGTDPVLQWYKDDVALDGATQPEYQIVQARAEDSGTYHCKAINSLGEAVSAKALVVIGAKTGTYRKLSPTTAELIADDRYTTFVGSFTIPASVEIDGTTLEVTGIAEAALAGCTKLTEVNFSQGLKSIGRKAFAGCTGITVVEMPSSLTTISNAAFQECSALVNVLVGAATEVIGDSAFIGCGKLTTVDFGTALRTIGNSAFEENDLLKTVVLPNTMQSVGTKAFNQCGGITRLILGEQIESVGKEAFNYCDQVTELTIPASLVTIGEKAFANMRGVTAVSCLTAAEELPAYLFYYWNSLKEVTLPATVKSIGKNAFYYCSKLESVVYEGNLEQIGEYAFYNCSRLLSLPDFGSVTAVGKYAFYNCSLLTEIGLPSVKTGIPTYAFYGCKKLASVTLAEGLTKIENYAFAGSGLTGILIPSTVTELGANAFQNCTSLIAAELPDGIVKAGNYLFSGCSGLKSVHTGNGLISLGTSSSSYTFQNCSKLEQVTLGTQLTTVGNYAFSGCAALKEIHYTSKTAPVTPGSSTFSKVPTSCKVYVAQSLEDTFKATNYWKILTIIGVADPEPVCYTDGVFLVNEDWFGWDYGTVNYLTAGHEILSRVYRAENPSEVLGITTQFGTIYGDNFYFVSKQANNSNDAETTGGRLVVADARTLKKKASFETIGGGDGRSFLGVDEETGYIATSKGIMIYDIRNQVCTELIGETGGGSSYSGQIGNMAHIGNYVFALKQSTGVLIIDPDTHEVVRTLPYTQAAMMTEGHDGNIWVAVSGQNMLVRIDPVTFETKEVACPAGVTVPSSWGAWNAGSLCSSTFEDALFFAAGSSFSLSTVVKYDMDKDEFNPSFFILPGQQETYKQILYGAGMRMNPVTRQLVLTATESGYGTHYQNNQIHLVDGITGELVKTIVQEPYYWFPAMPVFPDAKAPVIKREEAFTVKDQELLIAVRELATDEDNLDAAIQLRAFSGDESVAVVEVSYPQVKISPVSSGNTTLRLEAVSNGKRVTKEIPLQVAVSVGSEHVSFPSAVAVYPNPAADHTRVTAAPGSRVTVCDLKGNVVLSYDQTEPQQQIDLSALTAGVYVVRIVHQSDIRSVRLIKE